MGTAEEIKELKRRVDNCADGISLATETEVTKELITVIHEKIPNETISRTMLRNFEYVGTPVFSEEDRKTAAQIQQEHGIPVIPMGRELAPFACTKMPVEQFLGVQLGLLRWILPWWNWSLMNWDGATGW